MNDDKNATMAETRVREAGRRLEAGAAMTPLDVERCAAEHEKTVRIALVCITAIVLGGMLALAACGPAAGPYTGGAAPSGPSTGSTGEPRSTATGDSTGLAGDGTTAGSTSGSDSTSGSTGGEESTAGERCSTVPANPTSADPHSFVCICDLVVSDPGGCPLCLDSPCWPTDCWTGDLGCYCHGYLADPVFCEDAGSSGDSTGGTG